MEGRTLAIATYNSKLDDDFEIATDDPEEQAAIEEGMKTVSSGIEKDMDPIAAAARMDTDGRSGWGVEEMAECLLSLHTSLRGIVVLKIQNLGRA